MSFLPLQGDRTPKQLKWTESCPELPPHTHTAMTWTELIPLGTGGRGKGAGMALPTYAFLSWSILLIWPPTNTRILHLLHLFLRPRR